MALNVLPLIEVDFYNCMWNKRILTPQTLYQCNNDGYGAITETSNIQGGTGVAAQNVYPIGSVYAPPLDPTFQSNGWNLQSVSQTVPQSLQSSDINLDSSVTKENFYIEESRIRGGFSNSSMSLGVRAYLDEEDPIQQHRFNTLIYSGIYNSRTGLNRTNEFPVGTNITRSANPQYNTIQKIYAEENQLQVLQEDKCSRALIDKNAIFNAEGGGSVVTTNQVLGEIVPYAGEFGISKNPESFAIYANRKYFVDRNRNAVLRLSGNGVTEVSEYGMRDYFRDRLAPLNDDFTNTYTKELSLIVTLPNPGTEGISTGAGSVFRVLLSSDIGQLSQYSIGSRIFWSNNSGATYVDTGAYVTSVATSGISSASGYIYTSKNLASSFFNHTSDARLKLVGNYRSYVLGGWDSYNKQYIVSIQPNLTVSENTNGPLRRDATYFTLGFDEAINGWPSFYTFKPGQLGSLRSNFFTTNNSVWNGTTILQTGLYQHYDDSVSRGNFYNINNPSTVKFVANSQPSTQKVFLTIGYEGASGWKVTSANSDKTGSNFSSQTGNWSSFFDSTSLIYSYYEGLYNNPGSSIPFRAGFDRKENQYVANFKNNSNPNSGEIIFGNQVSGLKGFYLDVTMSTDGSTDPGAMKELYAVNLNYNVSNF
tara:strand:+ start:4870 stop:6816 length:1947 start_codon:yes stop_codon:yes gene_type:complete